MISAVGRGIIVVAPSNAAVANLGLKLVSTEGFNISTVCVYGDNCDKSVSFLNPVHRGQRFQTFLKSYKTLKDDDEKKQKLRDFASWLRMDPDKAMLDEICVQCPYIGEQKSLASLISSASVVLCTLNLAGLSALRKATQHKFHTLLFDEATQASEAEFYIATTFPGVRRIVVVGDPKQLPATVLDDTCRQAGYGESWMSNVFNSSQQSKVHLLNVQYRMDPKILQFSSQCFYAEKIVSSTYLSHRQPQVEIPFCIVDTMRVGEEERVRYSYQNNYEAVLIGSILEKDEDVLRVMQSNSIAARTIIITPYQAQVDLLKRVLKKVKGLKGQRWEVSTVDSFQGQVSFLRILLDQ